MKNLVLFLVFFIGFNSFSQTELDSIMISQINSMRTNPKSYIPKVKKYIELQKQMLAFVSNPNVKTKMTNHSGNMDKNNKMVNVKTINDPKQIIRVKIKTAEELIDVLNSIEPLNELRYNSEMDSITDSHGRYLDSTNTTGHFGPNGERPSDRFKKTKLNVSENIVSINEKEIKNKDFTQAILALLVDAFIETRGHRENLLNPDSKFISVYISNRICVQNFGH